MASTQTDRVRAILEHHGRTYADQAGITLADKPSPLYRLLVLSMLLSARISADIATAAAHELSSARSGCRRRRNRLAALVSTSDLPRLTAACVRGALNPRLAEDL